jgi:hypothetical protein
MKKHLALATLGTAFALALAVNGCKKEDPQNPSTFQGNNGYNNGQPTNGQPAYGQPNNGQPTYGQPNNGQPTYGQPTTGQPTTQPTATATQPNIMGIPFPFPMPGATGGTTQGGTTQGGTTQGGGQEVANNGMFASGGQQLLVPLQQQNAPGSQAASEALGGSLQEGQFIKTNVTLQPGKCYTGIAMASGPAEVVVELLAPAPLPPQVGSTSNQGNIAIFGAKANCVKNPLPMAAPAIFRVTSKKGGAPVFAQLYAKLNPAEADGARGGSPAERPGARAASAQGVAEGGESAQEAREVGASLGSLAVELLPVREHGPRAGQRVHPLGHGQRLQAELLAHGASLEEGDVDADLQLVLLGRVELVSLPERLDETRQPALRPRVDQPRSQRAREARTHQLPVEPLLRERGQLGDHGVRL